MTIKERIAKRLKPKVKQFGFSKKVFKSVAAKVADKLEDIDENASEEDINSKVDDAIEEIIPFLAFAQSTANEQLSEWKKGLQKNEETDDDDDEDSDDDDASETNRSRSTKSNRSKRANNETSVQSKEFKQLMDAVNSLTKEVTSLKAGKTADTRRGKLESLLKDTGVFGKRTLKNFSKMNFNDEDEFEEYLSEIEEDLKAYNQERADAGLSTAGNPPGGKGGGKQETKEEGFTDADIDKIMANF